MSSRMNTARLWRPSPSQLAWITQVSYFREIGRASYHAITDEEALDAFRLLSRLEGIIPALESSHAIALTQKIAKDLGPDKSIIVCLSGRGDKDVNQVKERFEREGK